MQYVDLATWKRKEHFNFFHSMDYPQINICTNLDATNFLKFVKFHRISFYFTMIYAVTRTANQTVEFRYRIQGDQVILHDQIHASFTYLNEKEDDLFRFLTVDLQDDLFEFVRNANTKARQQSSALNIEEAEGRDDLIYMTCLPWVSFTHISHPVSINNNDSIPRISWGKYFGDNTKVMLPFSVQVNHALMDGVHVCRFINSVQNYLDSLEILGNE